MNQMKISLMLAAVTVLVFLQQSEAHPYKIVSRQKRISDQRLAELETLIALSQMKNKMVTIPVGFGMIDPLKIGRRKRSIEELLTKLLSDPASREEMGEEMGSEESDGIRESIQNQLVYDDSQRISRYRHLPVRLPK